MYAVLVMPASPPVSHDGVARSKHGRSVVLRTVRRGAETLVRPQRPLRVDADVFVVDACGEPAAFAEPGTVPFLVELAIPETATVDPGDFTPTLRPIDGAVGRRLVELARRCAPGRRAVAVGETASALWSDLVAEERALLGRAARIACVKPGTREALFRRLLLSADYIHANFADPLNVELLAEVSNLSPFHFARLFATVMDETPHAFVVRKRLAVARRLLDAGIGRSEVAARTGFGSRSTLFRHLREAAATRP